MRLKSLWMAKGVGWTMFLLKGSGVRWNMSVFISPNHSVLCGHRRRKWSLKRDKIKLHRPLFDDPRLRRKRQGSGLQAYKWGGNFLPCIAIVRPCFQKGSVQKDEDSLTLQYELEGSLGFPFGWENQAFLTLSLPCHPTQLSRSMPCSNSSSVQLFVGVSSLERARYSSSMSSINRRRASLA